VARKYFAVVIGLVMMIGLAVFAVAGCGTDSTLPADAMAKVGKAIITVDQFNQAETQAEAQYGSQVPDKTTDPNGYKDFQRGVLDNMVSYEIVKQQAGALKISVSDKEVQDEINSAITSNFGGDQSKFDAALKSANLTLDQIKSSYRETLLMQKALDAVTKNLTDSSVTQAEIQSYYDAHLSDYFSKETRYVRHIWIKTIKPSTTSTSTTLGTSTTTEPTPTEADWATALATAEKVRADLVGGADWTTEAAKYSDDAGSKDSGGVLNPILQGSYDQVAPDFAKAVFSLKLGEISQPVKDDESYHIIQVTGIAPAKQSTLDEAKASVTATLLGQRKNDAWLVWIEQMKKKIGAVLKEGMAVTATTTTVPTAATVPSSTTTVLGATTTATVSVTAP